MSSKIKLIFLVLLITTGSARAGEEPATRALEPFAKLVGEVWVGTFPGGSMTDEQEFEWVYGGHFLRNVHRVRSADGEVVYEGETIYAWDPADEQIHWWYWNTTGGYIIGTLERTENGWLAEGTNHAPAPQPPRVRGILRGISESSWESVQYFEKDGEWQEQFTMKFHPKGSEGRE